MVRSKRARVNRKDILSKNRRKELKYFCLQYNDWLTTKEKIEEEINTTSIIRPGEKIFNDYTGKRAAYLADLTSAMELVERTTKDICKEYWYPVFIAVTNGLSWNELSCKYGLELEEDIYDQMLNKFFWLLSIRKGV